MNLSNVMVLALAVAATTSVLLIHVAEATDYTVGDDMGWTIPFGGAATYATWSNSHNLVLNDVLIFSFVTGQQDLILLATKDEFDACNTTNPYESNQDPGAFQIISEGTYHVTCSFPGHCSQSQKITLVSSAPPSSSFISSPAPSPSPCQNGAASVQEHGFKKIIPDMKSL